MLIWNGFEYVDELLAEVTGGSESAKVKNSIAKQLPAVLEFTEETAGAIDLSGVKLESLGAKKDEVTLRFNASSGGFQALAGSGITVTGAGSGTLAITGTLRDIMEYLENPMAIRYTGATDLFGSNAAAIGLSIEKDGEAQALGAVSVALEDERDDIIGTEGPDSLTGEDGRNRIDGLGGNDSLDGRGGDDAIHGGAGNDTISGGAGADTLYGDAGEDVLWYYVSGAGVAIDLAAGTASGGEAEGDVFHDFEHVYGSNFADAIFGDAQDNTLFGYAGDDVIEGRGGDDVIRGGAGADTLDGGEGSDWLRYLGSESGVTISLMAGVIGSGGDAEGDVVSNFENIQGSDHGDHLTGDDAANSLFGYAGDDTILAGGGNDTLRGGAGADHMDGGAGVDTLHYAGSAAGVSVNLRTGSGSGGDAEGDVVSNVENLYGSDHGDLLIGAEGRNYLYGYDGDDTLAGGEGKDVLRGMAGADCFVFDTAPAAANTDRILDFAPGEDRIVFDNTVYTALEIGNLLESQFLVAAGGVAQTAEQRLIYDDGDGMLYYDADGSGAAAALTVAQLTNRAALDFDDILIV